MKLQITYNFPDLNQALEVANQTAEFADVIGIGSLLLYKEGVKAVKTFKSTFPNKEIFAEAKIIEKAPDAISMFAQAGASYISVLAGASHSTIKKAVEAAKLSDAKVALDLLDAHSIGQSAHDAKIMGVDMLIMNRLPHKPEEALEIESEWHSARENTNLPIFITGKIDKSNIQQIIDLKPQGIMVGSAITRASSPKQEAHYIQSLV
jgi:3-hexulose-6-phosphate synthase